MNAQNQPQAFEINNSKGRAYWGMGILWTMLATAEDTDGKYSCIEDRAGSFVSVPRGTKHAFQIDSETVRLINTYVPAGFKHIIMATTVPAQARTLPPASMPLPELEQTNEAMAEVIKKYPAAKTNFLQGYDG